MASLDWQIRTHGDITLVEAQVTSPYETRVRLESALTPVWAPRRQGVPAAGWDDTGYETTVEAGETVAVGYASPATPVEPPLELIEQGPIEQATDRRETHLSSRDLLRTLGDSRPPRDIVDTDQRRPEGRSHDAVQKQTPTHDFSPLPLQSWFDAVENRLEIAEQLTEPTDATQARAAIAEHGGIERIRQLHTQLAADKQQLTALTNRQADLSQRLATTTIPIRTLERLE